jgi:hypothetical protein
VPAKRFHLFLVVAGVLILLSPELGQAQDRPRRGGGQRGQRGAFDPNMIFNFMSGGKDYIVISEVPANQRDPNAQQRMAEWAQRQGITNGQLTREQFASYMQERMAQFRGGRAGGSRQGPPGGGSPPQGTPAGGPGAPPAPGTAPASGTPSPAAPTPPGTTPAAPSASPPGNAAGTNATNESQQQNPTTPTTVPAPVEEDRRPTVYRVGKMPKDLPSWFEQLDTDQDGQVGLYEWKAAGRPVSEFVAMDRNGDGFITVEEALRYQKVLAKSGSTPGSSGRSALASAGPGPNGAAAAGSSGRGQGFRQRRGGPRAQQP